MVPVSTREFRVKYFFTKFRKYVFTTMKVYLCSMYFLRGNTKYLGEIPLKQRVKTWSPLVLGFSLSILSFLLDVYMNTRINVFFGVVRKIRYN